MKNQIDHFLISGQWRSSVQETRAYRGADANSNHYLMRTMLKMRLQTHKNKNKVKARIHVDRLKDKENERKFCESVRSKLQENRTETQDIDEMWEQQ